jgi:hypothetical protein
MLYTGLGLGSTRLKSCKHGCVNARVCLLQHDHAHLIPSLLTNWVLCRYHTPHKAFSASWVIYVDNSMHKRQRLRTGTYTIVMSEADHPAAGEDQKANYYTNKLSWRFVLVTLLLPSDSLQHDGSSSLTSKLHYQACE